MNLTITARTTANDKQPAGKTSFDADVLSHIASDWYWHLGMPGNLRANKIANFEDQELEAYLVPYGAGERSFVITQREFDQLRQLFDEGDIGGVSARVFPVSRLLGEIGISAEGLRILEVPAHIMIGCWATGQFQQTAQFDAFAKEAWDYLRQFARAYGVRVRRLSVPIIPPERVRRRVSRR